MRRLPAGLLIAAGLLITGCGGTDRDGAAPRQPSAPIEAPRSELVAATQASPTAAALDVVVTSTEGVDAPGLDALASVLLGRPDVGTTIVAPATDVTAAGTNRSTAPLAPIEDRTMTDLPALVVNSTAVDALETALATIGFRPDLVIVGFAPGTTIGPAPDHGATYAAARAATAAGIPALVVEVGDTEPDFAAAGRMLTTVLDFELDRILVPSSLHSLTIPSCSTGVVGGPVVVDASPEPLAPPTPDCTGVEPAHLGNDVAALAAGVAALVPR